MDKAKVLTNVRPYLLLSIVCALVGVMHIRADEAKPAAVAVIAGKAIAASEVEAAVGNRLFKLATDEYSLRRTALETLIDNRLLDQAAAASGTTVADYVKQHVDDAIREPSDEKVAAVYEGVRAEFRDLSREAALDRIRANIRRQRLSDRRDELLQQLRSQQDVHILLQPPRLAVSATGAASAGAEHPLVTIVEFSDFECPFCSRAAGTMHSILDKYASVVALYYRYLPLPMHQNAINAAKAAYCAGKENKFWAMHDLLFANQRRLAVADLDGYATAINLDAAKYQQCFAAAGTDLAIRADRDAAASYGVSGTPTFFVNGRLVTGIVGYDKFEALIQEEIQRSQSLRGDLLNATPEEKGVRK